MRKYINNLRKKPEHIRKQYLVGAMIVCMSVVCGIWIYGLTTSFGPDTVEKAKQDIKPFALFGQSVKDTYNSVTNKTETPTTPTVDQGNEIPLTQIETPNQ